MKTHFISSVLVLVSFGLVAQPDNNTLKPRIIVLTDVSTWETDDSESLVRLLVHADLFEIEGLVFTTGWSLDSTRRDFFQLIHDAIDAYERDLPNLRKRSSQKGHQSDESLQQIGYWPSAGYLRSRTVFGSKNRGVKFIGEGNDSPGSELIIKGAEEKDDRPVWVLVWGGGNTLAQAVWREHKDKSQEQLNTFLSKIRIYTITDQDREQRTPYDISSHQWMRSEFGKNLFFLWDESAWGYQNSTGKRNWDQYERHIQNHGNLGKVYPKYKYGVEGDTPSLLYVQPNGLNSPENPGYGGWGGYFVWSVSPDQETYAYTNYSGIPANAVSRKYEERFYPAIFNNFAARMDWAKNGVGNRNPVVIIDGDSSLAAIPVTIKSGTSIKLVASNSYDPDGDKLKFHWWVLYEAGTYDGRVALENTDTNLVTVRVPSDSAGRQFHLICEVSDDGDHHLTSYRRIIFSAKR